MTEEQIKEELKKSRKIVPKIMMGTKAYHQLGDISRDDYEGFSTNEETDEYWIGAWREGYGFFNVLFPKATSRELTQEEIDYLKIVRTIII